MSAPAQAKPMLAARSSQGKLETVKCRHCGFYNSPGRGQCEECGGLLAPPAARQHTTDEFSGRVAGEDEEPLGEYLHRNEYLPGPPVQAVLDRQQRRRQRAGLRRKRSNAQS